MVEKEVVIKQDIHGTLALPDTKGVYLAVLLLEGSGRFMTKGSPTWKTG